ncbi:hypothetical protein ACQPW3_35990 [Actinosynnema sp. CA-248983]
MSLLQVRSPEEVREIPVASAGGLDVGKLLPWRRFRSHRGQRHYSGVYWSPRLARPVHEVGQHVNSR